MRVLPVGLAVVLSGGWIQPLLGQIPIIGPTDEQNYDSGAPPTLTVPSEPGYIYPQVLLDGARIPTDFPIFVGEAGYHDVYVERALATGGSVEARRLHFIVQRPGVGSAEDGLPVWVPYPTIPSASEELAGAHLDVMMPPAFPMGMEIPVVTWIRDASGKVVRANGAMTANGHPGITLRRGVGSGFLANDHPAGALDYAPQLHGLSESKTIEIEDGTVWTAVSGTLNGDVTWEEDARISVTGSIQIPTGSTLTVLEGAVIRLNSNVDIEATGTIRIEGTEARPVVFTPVTRAQPWGGFYLTTPTSRLEATGAIFLGAGSRQSGFPGHRNEQPLLYIDNEAQVTMTNCAAIYLAGQFHHSFDRGTPYATVTLVDSLIQRCTTAGEFNGCSLTFIDSALIEVPQEDQFICEDSDCDHDGFYLNAGDHYLEGSLLGWVKDDCIDAGSGGGPSSVTMTNCWVEGAYHEGCAWSGGSRNVSNLHMVTINNQQGIEAGWSSGSAASPVVTVRDSFSTANVIGMRFGDNYDWDYWGALNVSESLVLHNFRDVWGMNWENWMYGINTRNGTFAMDVQNNFLTSVNTNHPNNAVWNPETDAAQLLPFMGTPPEAAVGIGFGVWEPVMTRVAFTRGVPIRLSTFTTNVVTVDLIVTPSDGSPLTNEVTFLPGESVKHIFTAGSNDDEMTLTLQNPGNGEITGLAQVTVFGPAIAPTVACRIPDDQMVLARLVEGIPVGLSQASAEPVSVLYVLEDPHGILASGILNFAVGQTLQFVPLAEIDPANHEFLRFALSEPTSATLGNPSAVYLVETATATPLANETFIADDSVWRYLVTPSAPTGDWTATGFDDSGWPTGQAELGYGESDQVTTIGFGPDANDKYTTTYFRRAFNVAEPADFNTLDLRLRRDDGGVVYLNGTEIFRSPNMPAGPVTYNTRTLSPNGENTIDTASFGAGALQAGANVVAVEIHQADPDSSDLSFNLELLGVPVPPPPPSQAIHLGQFDGQWTLAWGDDSFLLQTATSVEGPWSPSPATSPFVFTIDPAEPNMFFRLIRDGQ